MTKPKLDVRFWRAKMSAVARCMEGLNEDGDPIEGDWSKTCGWRYPSGYGFMPGDGEIRQRAKEHARFKVGHIVQVTVRDVATYWCELEEPEIAVEASAPLPPNDVPTP